MHLSGHDPKLARARLVGVTALVAAFAAACGGGHDGTETSAEADDTGASIEAAKPLAAPMAIAPISPADARWGTMAACAADADFVTITGSVPYVAGYASRHTACVRMISDREAIYAAVMPTADGKGYELCKRSAGRSCNYEVAGYATFHTKWQVYGPNNVLKKTIGVETRLAKWEWNPSFPAGKPSLSIDAQPLLECSTYSLPSGGSEKPCAYQAPKFHLPLSAGSKAAVKFDVTFDWTFVPSDGVYDVAAFRTRSAGLSYKAREADLPYSSQWQSFYTHGGLGDRFEAEIRCDRNVAGQNSGCVMPQAAAVFVLDSSAASKHAEAAEHVRAAQRGGLPGMTDPAPGVYRTQASTRVIADQNGDYSNMGLLYSPESEKLNRSASCNSSTSLAKTRPYAGSASCPTKLATCDCDEYPFAKTNMGAYYRPGSTSTRNILATHNRSSGGLYGGFLQRERVLSEKVATDPFWVYVK